MPTSASWISRFWRQRGGAIAVEFALMVPILLMAVSGITELGAFFQQVGVVEKGLRSAAMYAARSDLPLSASTLKTVETIARTGQTSGGSDLVAGWSHDSAKLAVNVSDVTTGGATVSVIQLVATLPYTPVIPVFDQLAALRNLTISATQEQVHIGG